MAHFKIPLIAIFMVSLLSSASPQSNEGKFQLTSTWTETKESKQGNVSVSWYTSKPFFFRQPDGTLAGIEYEIMELFATYLRDVHGVTLSIRYSEAESFYGVFETVKATKQKGFFGASNFSVTDERSRHVRFGPPYMMDISVLISSYDVPIVRNLREFDEVFRELKAICIRGTTYEKELNRIKDERNLDFDITFIPSSDNILQTIEKTDGAFGYIDLPVYLTLLSNNAALKVKRQNLFPVRRDGYSFILPKESDWRLPLDDFFASEMYRENIEAIIVRYMNKNVYDFIRNFSVESNEDVVLLTKEKEIQNEDLFAKSQQIEREARLRNYLISTLMIIGVFLIATAWLYITKNKANILLRSQKAMIESQRGDIELKKQELEKRNQQLEAIDKEKNHIINILAHDLRAPINQITALAEIMRMEGRNSGQMDQYTEKIIESAQRLHKMISKILDMDAIETNRVNLVLDNIEVMPVVYNVISSFRKIADTKNIRLNLQDGVKVKCYVLADGMYFTQVLENLISNAIKFSTPGKQVDVAVENSGRRIQISVKDEGPGFTEEDKKKLFQKFQVLSARPTGGEQSTGLGLSIVKKYIELMNGEVRCDSVHREGATFTVSLPVV